MTGTVEGDQVDVVGAWVTADGRTRQELLPDGRYDEARGERTGAYTGRYTVAGSHDGVLHHEHLVLYREQKQSWRRPSP
ncbi:Atu4866 domain-containing protein [Streptomyces aurantiacus]|uniref:Atu4866 domain-containing protein n=1 Tax=Streptomyces aurantiacus TaxID=47760 RepID=UPI0006E44212|nr:Atu4866 domain-containing protein [Streptomyces aurantiacus]